jgi:hypothetical protein
MRNKIIWIFALHLFIVLAHEAVVGYLFVTYEVPDPIGSGLQWWLCVILHFIITAVVCFIIRMRAVDKDAATIILLINLGAVIFWTAVNLLMSGILWDYLWSFRPEVIQ